MSEITTWTKYAESKYGMLLFNIGISLLLLFHGWYEFVDFPAELRSFYSWVLFFCLCLFLVRILLLIPEHPEYVTGVLLLLLFLCIGYTFSGRAEPILLVLAVAASRYCNHRTTSLVYMVAVIMITGMAPIFFSLGLTSDVVKRIGGFTGHSWGFFNPNVLAEVMMCGFFAALYFFKVVRLRYMIPLCWISALAIGMMTLCRSVAVSLFLFPLLFSFVRQKERAWRLESLPVIMLAVSVLLACYFGPVQGDNSLISRFSIPYYAYEQTGLTLLGGQSPAMAGVDVDNYILHHVLNSGILVGGLLLFLYSCLLYRIPRRNHDPILISMLICVTLLGFFTITPLDPLRNFMLLFYFDDTRNIV